jgi:glycosyltransferase involved in cell wall biosynthesis
MGNRENISVLLITPQLSIGGAENQVINLANNLYALGVNVQVMSSGGELTSKLLSSVIHTFAPISQKDPFHAIESIVCIRNIVKTSNLDIIHCHAVAPTIYARIATIGLNKPIICTGHGWAKNRLTLVVKLLKATKCHYVAISSGIRDEFIRLGFPPQKVSIITNSIESLEFERPRNLDFRLTLGASANQLLLGIIARISEERKGHSILIKAFATLLPDFPNLRLVIVGEGSLHRRLEIDVAQCGLSEFVKFTGNRQDIPDILASLDILVLPSLWEGLPVIVLEAMAAGKPVVATAVNGTIEVVLDGVTGVLVAPNDPLSLANGIRELLLDTNKAQAMGQAGKTYVQEHFSSKEMARKVESLYIQLLNEVN